MTFEQNLKISVFVTRDISPKNVQEKKGHQGVVPYQQLVGASTLRPNNISRN